MSEDPKEVSLTLRLSPDRAERVARAIERSSCEMFSECEVEEYRKRIRAAFARNCPDRHFTGTSLDVDTLMAYMEARVPRTDPDDLSTMKAASDQWFMVYGSPDGGVNTRWHITRDYRSEDKLWDAMAKMPGYRTMAEKIRNRRQEIRDAAGAETMGGSGGKRLQELLDAAAREGEGKEGGL